MLVARVVLGKPYPLKFTSPYLAGPPSGYHSVRLPVNDDTSLLTSEDRFLGKLVCTSTTMNRLYTTIMRLAPLTWSFISCDVIGLLLLEGPASDVGFTSVNSALLNCTIKW